MVLLTLCPPASVYIYLKPKCQNFESIKIIIIIPNFWSMSTYNQGRLFPSDKFLDVFLGSRQVDALRGVWRGDGVER